MPPPRCARPPRKSDCRPSALQRAGRARAIRDRHRLPRAARSSAGSSRRSTLAPGSARSGRRIRGAARTSCSIRQIICDTSGCSATLRRDYWAIPYGDRYIWGATAAMLLILERTLRANAEQVTKATTLPRMPLTATFPRTPPFREPFAARLPSRRLLRMGRARGNPTCRDLRARHRAQRPRLRRARRRRWRRRTACWPSTCPAAARATGSPIRSTTSSRRISPR